jgi:hypothetical protein
MNKYLRTNPVAVGIALGLLVFRIAALWFSWGMDLGQDCPQFFCRPYFPLTTIPAWGHIVLFPLSLLPTEIAKIVLFGLSLVGLLLLAQKLNLSSWMLCLVVSSPVFMQDMWYGQLSFLALFGTWLIMSNRDQSDWRIGFGLLLLSIKPQTSWLLCAAVVIMAIRDKRNLFSVGAPLGVFAVASFAIYGWWVKDWFIATHWMTTVSPLYPASAFIAIAILGVSMFVPKSNMDVIKYTVVLSLFSSPYILMYHNVLITMFFPILSVAAWVMFFVYKYPAIAFNGYMITTLACLLVVGDIVLRLTKPMVWDKLQVWRANL